MFDDLGEALGAKKQKKIDFIDWSISLNVVGWPGR